MRALRGWFYDVMLLMFFSYGIGLELMPEITMVMIMMNMMMMRRDAKRWMKKWLTIIHDWIRSICIRTTR